MSDETTAKSERRKALKEAMTPRKRIADIMRVGKSRKPPTRFPWGDEWNHPDNPAVWEGD